MLSFSIINATFSSFSSTTELCEYFKRLVKLNRFWLKINLLWILIKRFVAKIASWKLFDSIMVTVVPRSDNMFSHPQTQFLFHISTSKISCVEFELWAQTKSAQQINYRKQFYKTESLTVNICFYRLNSERTLANKVCLLALLLVCTLATTK